MCTFANASQPIGCLFAEGQSGGTPQSQANHRASSICPTSGGWPDICGAFSLALITLMYRACALRLLLHLYLLFMEPVWLCFPSHNFSLVNCLFYSLLLLYFKLK